LRAFNYEQNIRQFNVSKKAFPTDCHPNIVTIQPSISKSSPKDSQYLKGGDIGRLIIGFIAGLTILTLLWFSVIKPYRDNKKQEVEVLE
jgi:hypothetical protein